MVIRRCITKIKRNAYISNQMLGLRGISERRKNRSIKGALNDAFWFVCLLFTFKKNMIISIAFLLRKYLMTPGNQALGRDEMHSNEYLLVVFNFLKRKKETNKQTSSNSRLDHLVFFKCMEQTYPYLKKLLNCLQIL